MATERLFVFVCAYGLFVLHKSMQLFSVNVYYELGRGFGMRLDAIGIGKAREYDIVEGIMDDDDWALLQSWRDGDRGAGDTLIQRHFRPIARFFHHKVQDTEDAADLINQTFLACTESKERFRGDVPFSRFVFRIAVNVLQQYLRKKYKRERELLDFDSVCIGQINEGSLMAQVVRKQELQRVAEAMCTIPLDFQIVLELNVFEGLSGREIGELLGLPEPTVRGRLRLGKQRLAVQLEKPRRRERSMSEDPACIRSWAQGIRTLMKQSGLNARVEELMPRST